MQDKHDAAPAAEQPNEVEEPSVEALVDEVTKDTAGLLDDDAAFEEEDDEEIGLEVKDKESFQRVADLSLEEKNEKLKEFWKVCWEGYQVGDYLDAQDTYQKWMLAKIINLDNNGVEVRFDGWPPKWDLRFSWQSYKIAPLRRNTCGYTGQPKAPLRPKFIFSEETHAQEKIIVETMIERDFERQTAQELTQFLRGRLYVYTDFLLSGSHRDLTSEQQDMIDQYFKAVLRLIIAWMKKVPKCLHKACADLRKNSDIYLVDEDAALVASMSELTDMLRSFFCGHHRNMRTYTFYDRNVEKYTTMITPEEHNEFDFEKLRQDQETDYNSELMRERVIDKDDELVFGSALNYLNYFHDQGGFDALMYLLKVGNLKKDPKDELMPFEMVREIQDIFSNIKPLVDLEWFDNFVQQVVDILFARLDALKEADIKVIDRGELPELFTRITRFMSTTRRVSAIAEQIESMQIKLAIRFLKTSYLEKRLQGCNDLRNIIERVDVKSLFDRQRQKLIERGRDPSTMASTFANGKGQKVAPTNWIDVDKMREFLVNEKVIEILFGDSSHPELFKRAGPLIKFLCRRGGISQEIIDRIWACQDGKHEETVRVIYQVVIEMIPDLPMNLLQCLFDKVSQIPPAGVSEMYLNFLKNFTVAAFEAEDKQVSMRAGRVRQGLEKEVEPENFRTLMMVDLLNNLPAALEQPQEKSLKKDDHLYGMHLFWDMVQDGGLAEGDLFTNALNSLLEILKDSTASMTRGYFMLKALNNLQQGTSLFASLEVLKVIVDSFDEQDYDEDEKDSLSTQKVLLLIEKQTGLVAILMKCIATYYQEVDKSLKELVKKNKAPQDFSEQLFMGKQTHANTVQKLLDCLEFVVLRSRQDIILKQENIDKLWKQFVQQPIFIDDQALFLSFINKKRTIRVRLDPDVIDRLRTQMNNGNFQGDVPTTRQQDVQLFNTEEQKYLFTAILCNPTFSDYRKFSIGEARCFQALFRQINKEEGFIREYRSSFEVMDFEKIIGLDSLWKVAYECKQDKIRTESSELLVLLHLNLSQAIKPEAKKAIMVAFLNKCMRILLQVTKPADEETGKVDNASTKVLDVIKTLSLFLSRYEGKKPIKPEMRQYGYYQQMQPWTISVVYMKGQGQNQEGKIQVSQFESLGAVRQRIADFFSLDMNEFHMKVLNMLVDPNEDDEKYCKDFGMSQQIQVYPNPYYKKNEHPKYLIAQNREFFELLFFLLSPQSGSTSHVEPVWELLQKIPQNQRLLDRIKKLEGIEDGWNSLLDPSSTSKLLYSLKIIVELSDNSLKKIFSESKSPLADWQKAFVSQGGFKHLIDTFCNLSLEEIDSKLSLRCIESLVNTLEELAPIKEDCSHVNQDPSGCLAYVLEKKEAVVRACIRCIHLIGKYTLKLEKDRGETLEDLQAKKAAKKAAAQKKKHKKDDESDGEGEDEITKQMANIFKEFTAIKSVVEKLYQFMNGYIFRFDKTALGFVQTYPELKDFFTTTLVTTENLQLRNESGKKLREILVACSCEEELQGTITTILRVILLEVLPMAKQKHTRCTQFFEQVRRGIEDLMLEDLVPLEAEFKQLALDLAADIKEIKADEKHKLLQGTLNILRVLLQKYPTSKKEIGEKLLNYLLHDCLFCVPLAGEKKSPQCMNYTTRKAALQLITVLSRDCLENLQCVLNYMADFSRQASWRTNKLNDWQIMHFDDEKSSTGFVGMKNLGCICYMISLFQQLYMNPGFRKDVLAVEDPNHDNNEPAENMFYQFQSVFAGLQNTERQYVNPKGFCHAFKDWEGQPTNVLEQMDVEEFLGQFMDRLENSIKGTPQAKTIQTHFGGQFANEMIGKGCTHVSERVEPFLSLGIEVKHKKSVYEALTSFVQGDMLEGDNAYHCAKCDKKVDTLKRTVIKELPRFMIMTLKRFEFDMEKFIKVKVNDYCEFPTELDMAAYTQDGMNRKLEIERLKKEAAERGEEYVEEEIPLKRPANYYKFKLNGVVVHSGTADSGHYYSYIRDQQNNTDKWFEFNDNIVSDFNLDDLPSECFGGEENFSAGSGVNMKTQKWGNAYLLFYERLDQGDYTEKEEEKASTELKVEKKPTEEEQAAQEIDELLDESEKEAAKKLKNVNDPEHPVQQIITLENQKYWQNKFLFALEYFEFVADLSQSWDTCNIITLNVLNKNDDSAITGQKMRLPEWQGRKILGSSEWGQPPDTQLSLVDANGPEKVREAAHQVFKFMASFYLTILQRAQNKNLIPRLIAQLKSYLNYDAANGRWLLTEFSNWSIFEEMFIQVQGKEMPKLAIGLIYASMLKVYEEEKDKLESEKSILGNFIKVLLSSLYEVEKYRLNYANYFHCLSRFASLGMHARQFLVKRRVVGRLCDFFFGKQSIYRDDFINFDDLGSFTNNEHPEMGLPTKIDPKMMTYFQYLREKRREKELTGARPKYKFLFETISYCVLHLLRKDSIYALDDHAKLKDFVDETERAVFFPEPMFMARMIQNARKTRSMNALSKGLLHYAAKSEMMYDCIWKAVMKGLEEHDYDQLRPFFHVAEKMLEHPVSYCKKMLKKWLVQFMQTFQANAGYFKWIEAAFDFIFRLVHRNKAARDWFYGNKGAKDALVEWINNNPRDPGQGCRLYKDRHKNAMAQQTGENNNTIKGLVNAQFRRKFLHMLLQSQIPTVGSVEDFDLDKQDFQDYKFLVKDVVMLYDRARDEANKWQVTVVLDEMVSLTCLETDAKNNGQTRWIKLDTDKIVPEEMYNASLKVRMKKETRDEWIAQRLAAAKANQQKQAAATKAKDSDDNNSEDYEDSDEAEDLYR